MTPELIAVFVAVPLGLVTTAASGLAAVGVRRLLRSTDDLTRVVGEHNVELAEMRSKLPNGEWRAIKEGVVRVSLGLEELRGELGAHILKETQTMSDVAIVVGNCKRLLYEQQLPKPKKSKK